MLLGERTAAWSGGAVDNFIKIEFANVDAGTTLAAPEVFPSVSGTTYTFDWGDGSPIETCSGQPSSHTYVEGGDYTVKIVGRVKIGINIYNRSPAFRTTGGVAWPHIYSIEEFGESHITEICDNSWMGPFRLAITGYVGDLDECVYVGKGAFSGCSVTRIGNLKALTSCGQGAFDWLEQLTTIGDISNITGAFGMQWSRRLIGTLNIPNVTQLNDFRGTGCRSIYAPSVTVLNGPFYAATFTTMGMVTVGRLTSVTSGSFDRSKVTLNCQNTMDELMALPNTFPWQANTESRFNCVDGYITYENGAWTKHAAGGGGV